MGAALSVHPFAWLSDRAQSLAFTVLLLVMLVLFTFLMVLGEPMRTDAAPQGIVSFELARTGDRAGEILDSWPQSVRNMALLQTGIDYLFLVVYPALLSLGCVLVARRLRERAAGLSRLGVVLAWLVLLAGVLDAIENVALIRMLLSGPSDAMAGLAWACAVPKFALVAIAALYAVGGFVVSLFGRAPSDAPA